MVVLGTDPAAVCWATAAFMAVGMGIRLTANAQRHQDLANWKEISEKRKLLCKPSFLSVESLLVKAASQKIPCGFASSERMVFCHQEWEFVPWRGTGWSVGSLPYPSRIHSVRVCCPERVSVQKGQALTVKSKNNYRHREREDERGGISEKVSVFCAACAKARNVHGTDSVCGLTPDASSSSFP